MALYEITAETNDISHPFVLTKGDHFYDIQSIDLNDCYAEFPKPFYNPKTWANHPITEVKGGYITNADCGLMFADCENLTSFTSNLDCVVSGESMFAGCTLLTEWSVELPNVKDGSDMFSNCPSLTSITTNLSNLKEGYRMFYYCSSLTSFSIDMPKLENGEEMFSHCQSLTSFTSHLDNVVYGGRYEDDVWYGMFSYCPNLQSFNANMPKLENGDGMFMQCFALTSFTSSNLNSLKRAFRMFEGCHISSFNYDLLNLEDGDYMFFQCIYLESFNADMPKLQSYHSMFADCTSLKTFESDLTSLIIRRKDMFEDCEVLEKVTVKVDTSKRGDWESSFTKDTLRIRQEAELVIKDINGNVLKTYPPQ